MAKNTANLLSGLSNSKTRTFVIIFGAIILIGIIIAVIRGKHDNNDVLSKQTSQVLEVPTDIKATPGSVVPEKQRELLMKENERRAQEALQKKSSAIPTIIGAINNPADKNSADAAAIDEAMKNQQRDKIGRLGLGDASGGGFAGGGAFGAGGPGGLAGLNGQGGLGSAGSLGGAGGAGTGGAGALGAGGAGALGAGGAGALGAGGAGGENPFGKSAADRARELQEQRLREQREMLEKQRAEQERLKELERQRRLAEQQQKEYEASVQKIAGQMKSYAGSAYADWTKMPTQSYVSGALANKAFPKADTTSSTQSTSTSGASPAAQRLGNVRPTKSKVYIKAGTILFGVMDTAVNTDEPGPVLATIVGGKYTGGRLIGTFTHQAQQTSLTLSFNQMTVPKRAKSFGVSVVAIDPDTARTALATDYDRHLLQRYGSLFASSFIQGYGQAVAQQGGTTTTSPLTGTTTTTSPPLDNRQIFYVALGELGKQWSQAIKPYFNTPYTVTVDQGTSVGLLFLSDVDVSDEF